MLRLLYYELVIYTQGLSTNTKNDLELNHRLRHETLINPQPYYPDPREDLESRSPKWGLKGSTFWILPGVWVSIQSEAELQKPSTSIPER